MENKSTQSINLRTLALKSKIGFGTYKLLTVQELINLGKEPELIGYYYFLGMINFNQEVKDLLCITPEREIKKPGKGKTHWCHICYGECLDRKYKGKDGNFIRADRAKVKGLDNGKLYANLKRIENSNRPIKNRNYNQK
jgi:hypothetical protein